jgi:hypothetical protein
MALCIEEVEQQEQQINSRKPLEQIELLLIPMHLAYLVQHFPCSSKWWKFYVVFIDLKSYFPKFSCVITVNDTEICIEIE